MSESGTTTAPLPSARSHYAQCLEDARTKLAEVDLLNQKLVWLRTTFFVVALVCLVLGYGGADYPIAFLSVGWLAVAGFFYAIVRHEHLRLSQLNLRSDERLYGHLLARLYRDWENVEAESLLPEFAGLAYADDLDIGGPASLLSVLSLAGTLPGRRTLQSWIATPPDWNTVKQRQLAVKNLVPERSLRLQIIKTIRACSDGTEEVYGLPNWGKSPQWLPEHKLAHGLSYIGPVAVVTGGVLLLVGTLGENQILTGTGAGILTAGILSNVLVTVFWGSWIHDIFRKVTGEHRAVYQFADVFQSLATLPQDDGLLDNIRKTATEEPHCATTGFGKLMWIVMLANLQRDPMLYFVYLALQMLFLWDFRVLRQLEKWKTQFGPHVGNWFSALGECEALISGSTLADEYTDWTYPTVPTDDRLHIHGQQIGHPLISDEGRVANDLLLEPTRPLLLVTGSNMAGKSTFMRALGLNVLLARTGSPVCATSFQCPLFELATSIRVRDSLRDGVSFFMAELQRLKEVVDLAQYHAQQTSAGHNTAPVLFLLDEILQGTNNRERLIAVASVINKLLKSGAIGVVSTHDLDLAASETMQSVSQIVHFREYFETDEGKEVMRFDYLMRPGSTPTTNALKLLKLVGLDTEETL